METSIQQLSRSRYSLLSDPQSTITDIGVAKFLKFLQRTAYAQTKIDEARFELALECEKDGDYRDLFNDIGQVCAGRVHRMGVKVQQLIQLCQMFSVVPKIRQENEGYVQILINYFNLHSTEYIGFEKFKQILQPRYKQTKICTQSSSLSQFNRNKSRSYSKPQLKIIKDLRQQDRRKDIKIKKFVECISIIISEYYIVENLRQELFDYAQQLSIYLHKKYRMTVSGGSTILISKIIIKQFMEDHQMYNKITFTKISNYIFGTSELASSLYLKLSNQKHPPQRQKFYLNLSISPIPNSTTTIQGSQYKSSVESKSPKNNVSRQQITQIFGRIKQLEAKMKNNQNGSKNDDIYQQNKGKMKKQTITRHITKQNTCLAHQLKTKTKCEDINNIIDKKLRKALANKDHNKSVCLNTQKYQELSRIKYKREWNDEEEREYHRELAKAESQIASKLQQIERRAHLRYNNTHYGVISSPQFTQIYGSGMTPLSYPYHLTQQILQVPTWSGDVLQKNRLREKMWLNQIQRYDLMSIGRIRTQF